jgi:hypothetical protein
MSYELLLHFIVHVATQVQGLAPLERARCRTSNQQLFLQSLLQTYGQAGAQPAVGVVGHLRSAAGEAGISSANGNMHAIIQSLHGQVVPALLPQFIAGRPVISSAQAVLALQHQPQPDPENHVQLAALLAAMDETSGR